MYNCSICSETFCEVSTFTTLCGHVFHSECISKWLERKQNCPQCRTTVMKKDLIKLFLEHHPSTSQNNEIVLELNKLKNQLKTLNENKKINETLIVQLENQLQDLKANAAKDLKSIQSLNNNSKIDKTTITDLHLQLERVNIDYKKLQELNLCSENQCKLEQIKNRSLEKDLHEVQSVNSIVIDKLNAEIADLKSEKAYLQDKCCSLENQNKLPSTSKVRIKNEDALSHDHNTIQNTFYGHDPKLTLSSKKFLLGCVFLFIGDQNQFEDICSDISMLKLNIVEHGGSVELSYSSRITHLICVTQKHYLVEQALKDGKRCVTDYWLNDIIIKKCMLPPWLAYHFPLPYSNENNLPCELLQIAITNFQQNYHIISAMVKLTGAHVVTSVSSNTDVVVSMSLSGNMVDTALALKRPVVNVQWLNDILFGAINGIKNPENIKYQQFSSSDPFFVNYDMVSHLMEAWKSPVVFLQTNEVYDLTGSSADPLPCKRQKTNSIENEAIDLVDDECSNDLIITYVKNKPRRRPCILLCGFETEVEQELREIVVKLGGKIANYHHEGTHLVMNKPIKTLQFLSCLTSINHVVGELWIRISRSLNRFADEKHYCIKNIYDNYYEVNRNIICDVQRVLQNSQRHKLFEHMTFFITPGIEFPPPYHLELMIESAGGKIERQLRSFILLEDFNPDTHFIISCFKELRLLKEFSKFIKIYKTDFITNAIMQQRICFSQNQLIFNEQTT